jgi:hypothetical protein
MSVGRVSKIPLASPFMLTRIAPILERLEGVDDDEARNASILLREIELDLIADAFPTQSERDQMREAFLAAPFESRQQEDAGGLDWFNHHCLSLLNDLDRRLPRLPQPGLDYTPPSETRS